MYHKPTTVAAEPGFFVARFWPRVHDERAMFNYTPIVAWLIQAQSRNELFGVGAASVRPITLLGLEPEVEPEDKAPVYIRHPDGSFTCIPYGDRYANEQDAIEGATFYKRSGDEQAKLERTRKLNFKVNTGKPLDIYDVRAAARWVFDRTKDGREIVTSILAAHDAKSITTLDPVHYRPVTQKFFEKVPTAGL
jgi:hypothetical protein